MRQIKRSKLNKRSLSWFAKWTQQIIAKPIADQKTEAENLWVDKSSRNLPIKEARAKLARMASGLARCMYCEDNLGTDIDHFYPKSAYPHKTFLWENFILACSKCNSGQRSATFPLDAQQQPLLIDPTAEDPQAHLILTPSTGKYRPASGSAKGQPTLDAFGLNTRSELVRGRQNAWIAVQDMIAQYAQAKQNGDTRGAELRRKAICQHPFVTVFCYVVTSKYQQGLSLDCKVALQSCPEISQWLI